MVHVGTETVDYPGVKKGVLAVPTLAKTKLGKQANQNLLSKLRI